MIEVKSLSELDQRLRWAAGLIAKMAEQQT
jgi:hypothetical protein